MSEPYHGITPPRTAPDYPYFDKELGVWRIPPTAAVNESPLPYIPFAPSCWPVDEVLACPDNVNHPPHYTQGGIECIDAIRAMLTEEEFRGFCKGTMVAYIWRERHKGGDESLEKSGWYNDELLGRHA